MTKRELENALIGGGRVTAADVARTNRKRDVLTLRYRWPENVDGRIWHGVRDLVIGEAQRLAASHRLQVEIMDPRGWVIEVVEPEGGRK